MIAFAIVVLMKNFMEGNKMSELKTLVEQVTSIEREDFYTKLFK